MNWAGYLPRSLPPPLLGLYELAIDLRWSWNHAADSLWEFADPQLWHATNNPWLILQAYRSAYRGPRRQPDLRRRGSAPGRGPR